MLGGVGANRLQQALPSEVRSADDLAKIIGGPGIFTEDFRQIQSAGQDFFVDVRYMIDDINALLRAPGSRLARPHEVVPMPTASMPEPPPIDPMERPFRPQPVKVQPYVISQDPEADLRLGDASPLGGPVSGRDLMLVVLKKVRDTTAELQQVVEHYGGSGGGDPVGDHGDSLGRFIGMMRDAGAPMRSILKLQEKLEAGTLGKEDLVEALKVVQQRGVGGETLQAMKRDASAVLKALRAGEMTGVSVASPGDDRGERAARALDALSGMNAVLFDLARLQMRVALAVASEIQA